jgi:Tol biopolymer transport system component
MLRAAVIALVVASCYRPEPSPGAPCPTGECPVGQTCIAGTCRAEGDPGPGGPEAGPPIDADPVVADASIDAPIDAPRAWSAPVLIPGVNSTADESDPSLTADRLTIVFSSDRAGGLGSDDIYLGTRASTTAAFTVAPITAINSSSRDASPEISADGNTLYFTSNRGSSYDVYVSTRSGGVWSAPQAVAELNTSSTEGDVAISPDGLTLLVERTEDIYIATRASTGAAFGTPALVAILDVTGDVAAPTLTNGAAAVYLHGGATRDIYVAYRQGTTFTTPVPVTEVNTASRDAAPFISADGTRLVFERSGELYESTR